jgi:hypothetical protein
VRADYDLKRHQHHCTFSCLVTNVLTATWQFDCCELFFVVFLKGWPKLRYEAGAFDGEGFDIYSSRLSIDGALRGIASVPAITSASLLEVRDRPRLLV